MDVPCCDLGTGDGGGGVDPCVPIAELCNNFDDDCDDVIDNGNPEGGGPCGVGCDGDDCTPIGECTLGVKTCLSGQLVCVGDVRPVAEECDGLDNDCDGQTDEGFDFCSDVRHCGSCTGPGGYGQRGPCGIANAVALCDFTGCGTACAGCARCRIDTCRAGYADCQGDSPPNDCDCRCAAVPPGPEICDGVDNDCDGLTDEGPFEPGELCNGQDDDCDGLTDESCCGVAESCNCQDDDCDGLTDDSVARRCFSGAPSECPDPASGACVGLCRPGWQPCETSACPSPGWGECVGEVGPRPESCNCQDDDCNGLTDDDVTCPGGGPCVNCACTLSCDPTDEFPCPAGFICSGWCGGAPPHFCIPAPCIGVTCDVGSVCDECTGECVDLCEGVDCGGLVCCAGDCCESWESCQDTGGVIVCLDVSCNNPDFPCAPGQVCIDHRCVDDPCTGVHCEPYQYCMDGECVSVCPYCRDGEKCVDGQCVPDPCADITCVTANTVCCDGVCVYDRCATEVLCEPGEYCHECTATCMMDLCPRISCPPGFACRRNECVRTDDRPCRICL